MILCKFIRNVESLRMNCKKKVDKENISNAGTLNHFELWNIFTFIVHACLSQVLQKSRLGFCLSVLWFYGYHFYKFYTISLPSTVDGNFLIFILFGRYQ